MKKIGFLTILCLTVLICTFFVGCNQISGYPGDIETDGKLVRNLPDGVSQFDTLEQLLAAFPNTVVPYYYGLTYRTTAKGMVDFVAEDDVYDSAMSNSTGAEVQTGKEDYSVTNIQTEGVDEGDIVKTDGEYIYTLNSSGFNIVRVEKGELSSVYSLAIDDYYPIEMYADGDLLVLIGGIYERFDFRDYNGDFLYYSCLPYYRYNRRTDIRIYDISDRTAPTELRHLTIDGYLNTSRMADGTLYYIVDYSFSRYYISDGDDIRPEYSDSVTTEGKYKKLPLSDIYKIGDNESRTFSLVGKINVADGAVTECKLNGYLGANGEVYVSADNIYFAGYTSEISRKKDELTQMITERTEPRTIITKIRMSDLSVVAQSSVSGSIKDRFSMDEYEGNLRIATTTDVYSYSYKVGISGEYYYDYEYQSEKVNRVFVLNENLQQIGLIDNIAKGESIYSCRFRAMTGSLVTFETIDPYYNLDLTDPQNPKISKGLKEDGVSKYIHYLGDSGYTIGVGVDTYVNDYGNAVSAGLKISMYDNRSGEAVNVQTYILGEHGYTPLDYEPHALLYDESIGLFAFPVSYYEDDYLTCRQGLAVFRFDTEKGTLEYRGLLSNTEKEYEYYYLYYYDTVSRGIRIGDYIYTIADSRIVSYELETLKEHAKLVF